MNTEKFLNQIRQIIREEVRTAVESEFSILLESLDKVSKRSNKIVSEQRVVTAEPKKFTPKKSNIPYSSNPIINNILNETASSGFSTKDFQSLLEEEYNPGVSNQDEFTEWPTMKNMSNLGMTSMSSTSMIPKTDIDGRPVQEVAPEVEQALTRDYSSLMKAINKKKGK
jgi:hypothetical protein